MIEQRFPLDWDQKKVQDLIAYYDSQSDEELAAADDAAAQEREDGTVN